MANETRPRRRTYPYGLWILGREGEDPRSLRIRMRILLAGTIVTANIVGAGIVVVLVNWVVPGLVLEHGVARVVLFALVPSYIAIAVVVGVLWGSRRITRRVRWIEEDRPPTEQEQKAALRAPLELLRIQAVMWAVAAVGFTTLEGIFEPRLIFGVGATVVIGGAVTCAVAYLVSEVVLRPVAARALAFGLPEGYRGPGVRTRALLAWSLGSGMPLLGLVTLAVFAVARREASATQIAVSVIVIGTITLVVGLGMTALGVRGTVDPIRDVTRVVGAVETGRYDTHTTVYDGSEIGQLQAGVNRMVDGLAERERLRDLFGRHVGEEVARTALERGVELGGELRDVAVVFVDIVGSTSLTAERAPAAVVEILNEFFAIVVDVVADCGGHVNKFEGDAALIVFGAPDDIDDASGTALRAARVLGMRLARDLPDCRAGMGVSSGLVVAGNIGAEERYEYTVIGDPVNEAARLTELAKSEGSGAVALTLASAAAVESAATEEAANWQVLAGDVVLRGRTGPTRLATPRR